MSNRFNGFSSLNRLPELRMQLLGPMIMALVGAWFGFANPFLHFPPAILLLPAALVLTARQAAGFGQAFRLGLLTTLPGYAASLYWLAIPVHDHGHLPWALALPCPVLIGGLLAAYAGVFCSGLFLLKNRLHNTSGMLFAGLLWASLELLRNHFLTGFSWLTLSSAFAPWPDTLGLAAWIGSFGLSGVLVAISHTLTIGQGWRKTLALPLAGLCLLPALIRSPHDATATAFVVSVQGNIDQGQKWDEALQGAILQTYFTLSRQAVQTARPDLIIWPETAAPFYFQDPSDLSRALRSFVSDMGVPVLTGSPAYSIPSGPDAPQYVLHNRAYLLNENGEVQSWYDKEHLVPFGEYVPLGKWLPFVRKLVPGEFEFGPGLNTASLNSGPLAMGLLICYEAIFPELAQKQVAMGANVLVNISNDAWFGRSSAPWQHLHLAVLRAVEQGRAIIRATNTGVSALIGPDGHLQDATQLFSSGIMANRAVPLLTETTFYHDHFFWIHAAYPLLGALLFATIRRRDR